MRLRAGFVVAMAAALVTACISLAPRGEALIVVDTDLPVPKYASRLRLDVYSADGTTWTESRETPLRSPSDWPASFSLYTDDDVNAHVALVRVRIFQEGETRDYRGERFTSRAQTTDPAAEAIPAAAQCDQPADCQLPRLIRGGLDLTPPTEPHPYLAVDRLVRVRLVPGVRGKVVLKLRGDCIGTMADMQSLATCVDSDAQQVPVVEATLDPDMTIPAPVPKTFGPDQPCPADAKPRTGHFKGSTRLFDEEVCVPGGTYFFGTPGASQLETTSTLPRRVATVPPFYMDKYEVTVGRWRAALARGFRPSVAAITNPVPLSRDTCKSTPAGSNAWCTYSTTAGVPEDRETYALSCVDWRAAREFCQFEGGDLPSEAQWEWAAMAVGRPQKTVFPWGDQNPGCGEGDAPGAQGWMSYMRLWECSGSWYHVGNCIKTSGAVCTDGKGFLNGCGAPPVQNLRQGPHPCDETDVPGGDRSVLLGIVNMGGGLEEYTLDSLLPLRSQCWASAPIVSPVCLDPTSPQHTLRGDAWAGIGYGSGSRRALQANARESNLPQVGFRCVRPVEVP
jgi:formylglycine-generating enzyme required for sulfatase activity